ncbi:MAG: acyl carrier protein [Acidobacteria bacterium]|nr:MAG: acyl carrier protein [Acidobacteriota bacterium]
MLDKTSRTKQDVKMIANNSDNSVLAVKERVRAFVLEYAAGKGLTELKDDEPLLTNNIIDSLGSFRMIAFLEETFPLTIEDTDMVPENFQTLNDVESFVASKLGKIAPVNN